jgi:hypothetical protein
MQPSFLKRAAENAFSSAAAKKLGEVSRNNLQFAAEKL